MSSGFQRSAAPFSMQRAFVRVTRLTAFSFSLKHLLSKSRWFLLASIFVCVASFVFWFYALIFVYAWERINCMRFRKGYLYVYRSIYILYFLLAAKYGIHKLKKWVFRLFKSVLYSFRWNCCFSQQCDSQMGKPYDCSLCENSYMLAHGKSHIMDIKKNCLVSSPRPGAKAAETWILNHSYPSKGKDRDTMHPRPHAFRRLRVYKECSIPQMSGESLIGERGRRRYRGNCGSISIHKRQMNP